jgi:hypothetical protein
MTERLSSLLHDEADRLELPPAPVSECLHAGRRLRRRRRAVRSIAACSAVAAVVAAVGMGAAVLDSPDGDRLSTDHVADFAPAASPVDLGPVFASGNTVYVDDGETAIELPEVVQAIYYTSAGVLLRTSQNGQADGGAPFHFSLVKADHTVEPLDLTLGELMPSTDPELPYLAYAEVHEGTIQVVVHDVASDTEVARIDVPGLRWSGGWEAPPVTLAGDQVYVGTKKVAVVDIRTGDVGATDEVDPVWPSNGGRAMRRAEDGALEIVDVASGRTLVRVPGMEAPWGGISPDGRWATVYDQVDERDFDVYDLGDGTHVTVDAVPWDFGWTAAGDLYSVDDAEVHVCDAGTGDCVDTLLPADVNLDQQQVLLGGRYYES